MLHVTEIAGDVSDACFSGRRIERLPVGSADASKRRLRSRTDAGSDVVIDLPRGAYLRHGAVLADDGERVVVVERVPEETLVVRLSPELEPEELLAQALRLGHAFGNQHVPVEVEGAEVRIPVTTSSGLAAETVRLLELRGAEVRIAHVRLGTARPLHVQAQPH